MGQELSIIEDAAANGEKPLEFCCQPLEKVYEYHSLYRSVCETFTLSSTQFEQIFGGAAGFSVWEKEQSDKADALELFAGLAIFAEGEFKRKLRFLFDLFDFNEARSLSTVDLEYMLVCISNSALKAYGRNGKVNNSEVAELVRKMAAGDQRRMIITRLLRCCVRTPEVRRFFEITGREFPEEAEAEQ